MSTYEPSDEGLSTDVGQQQIQVMMQLMKVVPTMHTIDELFQWLAYAIVNNFDLQLAQFWTPYMSSSGMTSTHLRMMVARDPSLPEGVVVNDQMFQIVRRLIYEQRTIASQPVDVLFPLPRGPLLKRYGLNYCAGSYMSSNVLLPSPNNMSSDPREATPFSLTTLLFLSQHGPWDLMPSVSALLKQAIRLATNRGLLLTATPRPNFMSGSETPPPLNVASTLSLFALIPRGKEGNNFLTSNPFARDASIQDARALRLHRAINGKKNVAELCRSTGIDKKDISAALRLLLNLNRIELINVAGEVIDPTLFFPDNDM